VVVTFSDCDPAGWQMPVSIARKRQAFSVLDEGMASFQAVRTVLTPDQAGKLDLPSTPAQGIRGQGGQMDRRDWEGADRG